MRPLALLSVTNKEGIVDFARYLLPHYRLLSTGGTFQHLVAGGVTDVIEVSTFTGVEEMFDGRVKTLNHKIFAGILARPGEDMVKLEELAFDPIGLVCVNLYDFEATAKKPGITLPELVEQIDIGGPSLLRAAFKNYARVLSVCKPTDYPGVIDALVNTGRNTEAFRYMIGRKAIAHTAAYDEMINATLPMTLPA